MTLPKRLFIRLLAWGSLVLVLSLDLFFFQGPTHRWLHEPRALTPEAQRAYQAADGVVASIYQIPIFQAQVRERQKELAWRRGQWTPADGEKSAPFPDSRILREEALAHLIEEALIKVQIRLSPSASFPIDPEQVEQALSHVKETFADEATFRAALAAQGWREEPEEARLRISGRLERAAYLVHQTGPTLQELREKSASLEEWLAETLPDATAGERELHRDELKSYREALLRREALRRLREIVRAAARSKTRIDRARLYRGL